MPLDLLSFAESTIKALPDTNTYNLKILVSPFGGINGMINPLDNGTVYSIYGSDNMAYLLFYIEESQRCVIAVSLLSYDYGDAKEFVRARVSTRKFLNDASKTK